MVGRSAPFLCTKSGAGSSFNIGAHLAFRFIIGQRTGELRTDERQKVKFLFSLYSLSLLSLFTQWCRRLAETGNRPGINAQKGESSLDSQKVR